MKNFFFKSWVSTKELEKGGMGIGTHVKETMSMFLYQTKYKHKKLQV